MKKYTILLLSLITLLIIACAPSTVASVESPNVLAEIDPAQLLFVTQAEQPALFDRSTHEALFTFPEGKLSADKSTYAAAHIVPGATMLTIYDAPSGQQTAVYTFGREWHLNTLSPNAEFIVMTRIPRESEVAAWREVESYFSEIRVIETSTGQVLEDMKLEGNYEVEAIDNEGDAVFMIQHLPAIDPVKYQVRFYDRSAGQIDERILRDKRVIEEFMTGYAWGTVATEDGSWLMTLYMNTARDNAFVHALDINNRWTFCLNLPSAGANGDFDKLKQYNIAVTPDNRTLVAANPAIGIVAIYNLETFEKTYVTMFDPVDANAVDHMQMSYVSEDGRFFYFSQDNQLWEYNLQTHQLSEPMQFDENVTGLEVEANRLFVTTQEALHVLDTAVFAKTPWVKMH